MGARVVHCKRSKYDVYIGRPSKWGNPFSHRRGTAADFLVESREDAIRAYDKWLDLQPDLIRSLPELSGKVLGCWCKPKSCHGDILVRRLNEANLG